ISIVLGTQLPGPGTICTEQKLRFLAPVAIGDTLTVRIRVTARDPATQRLGFACVGLNQHGATVIAGNFDVQAPAQRIEYPRTGPPEMRLRSDERRVGKE